MSTTRLLIAIVLLITMLSIMLVVHPVAQDGKIFMPCGYGYAMTIRRAQGSTLGLVAICFDQPHYPAEKAYAYVAVSRVRYAADVFYFGKVRTSDWTPNGMVAVARGIDSESDSSDGEGERTWDDDDDDYRGENSEDDRLGLEETAEIDENNDRKWLFM